MRCNKERVSTHRQTKDAASKSNWTNFADCWWLSFL